MRFQQALNPTDEQRTALDELGNASVQAAQIVKSSCPTDVSLTPIGRIDAMQQRVQAMLSAVKVVRPALEKFYNLLTDEQKARFNALGQNQRPPANEGSPVAGNSPAAGCKNRAIPDWPTAQIQRTVHPTGSQQAALDTLQNAAAKSKDILEFSMSDRDACHPAWPSFGNGAAAADHIGGCRDGARSAE